jgi:hypothetical protein
MPENVHLYRAAVLTWRKAEIEERSRHADIKLANPHVAEHAAALVVHELAPEMTYAEAWWLAHKAASWGRPGAPQMVLAWYPWQRIWPLDTCRLPGQRVSVVWRTNLEAPP